MGPSWRGPGSVEGGYEPGRICHMRVSDLVFWGASPIKLVDTYILWGLGPNHGLNVS